MNSVPDILTNYWNDGQSTEVNNKVTLKDLAKVFECVHIWFTVK